MQPLRFCLVTTFYPPSNFGGDGISVQRLAVALAEAGHHVEVVHAADAFEMLRPAGGPPVGDYSDHPAIKHHNLRTGAQFLSNLITQQTGAPGLKAGRLRAIFREGNFDVIHFHNASLIGLTALGYERGAVTLYTTHEHWLVCPMHVLWRYDDRPCPGKRCIRCSLHGHRPPQIWRYTKVFEKSLENVDAFIVPSTFTREKHLEFGLKVKSPMVHIPNFLPPPKTAAEHDPSPHSEPYFLFVGRLEQMKGAHLLVDVFTRYRGANLLLAGSGGQESSLKALAEGHEHICFLGSLDSAAIERLMRHAIALIVPSIGFEVFPTTVLEANAQATPVIGNRLGPLPEMLHGHGGITYSDEAELIAAMEKLRVDPAARNAIGRRGHERYLAEWTPEQHLSRYFDLILKLQSEKVSFA